MRRFVVLSSVLLFSVMTAPVVYACSCIPNGPPQEALAEADFVFAGEVLDIERVNEGYGFLNVTLRVERPFKGVFIETTRVRTATNGAACGFPFERGERYIVYTHTSSEDGSVWASLCSRTADLQNAREDLVAFDALDLLQEDDDDDGGGRCGGPTNAAAMQAMLFVFFIVAFQRRRWV